VNLLTANKVEVSKNGDGDTIAVPDLSQALIVTDVRGRDWLHISGLVAATLISLFLTYLMTAPFLPALTSAVALSVILMPVQNFLMTKTGRPGVSAFITVLAAAFVIILLVSLLGNRLVHEATTAAQLITISVNDGSWRQIVVNNPSLRPFSAWAEAQVNLPQTAENAALWLANNVGSFLKGSGAQLFTVILTFYILFYMLRDHRLALAVVGRLSPLSRSDMARLVGRTAETIRATLLGTIAVSMVQGTLGGLMFWALGLPMPLLWGIVMGLAAIVPTLGTFIIWIPGVIFLMLSGNEGRAIILAIWGMVVVGGIDNLLYPVLVGTRLKMHTIPTFISLVGGLFVFGPAGLILGPVVFTVTMFLVEYWREHESSSEIGVR
jgi:predicted PurR-regulated permease PerM